MSQDVIKKATEIDKKILTLIEDKIRLINDIPEEDEDLLLKLRSIQPGIETDHGSFHKEIFEGIYDSAFKQRKITVAYLGPEATNTHQAAVEIFGGVGNYLPQMTILDIFRSVEDQKALFGVVPIENSMEGTINLTLDLLNETNLKIFGEKTLPITHNLIGSGRISEIREIYSHPQVLGQCRKWIRTRCPEALPIETSSSAMAVKKVKNKKGLAAIGTALAAKLYDCPILETNIQDSRSNKTRFFIISDKNRKRGSKNKTSLVFLCQDKPGALVEVLKVFKRYNINLSKIESRPSRQKNWEYYFYVDFLGHEEDEIVMKALDRLRGVTVYSKVLGSYPAG